MADKPRKQQKLKARLPRGLEDRSPAAINATRQMVEKIRAVYELYGFEPVETPAFEYTDALGKFLPDQDRPNEGVFSFQDDDEQWISLRYDLTAPLARYVAENFDTLPKPYRSYRFGWVFRNEKPGPGRFRQFMQFDADTVGAPTPAADAEMCMMAADTMEALGLGGQFIVKVNNRKVLDGVLLALGLDGEENAQRRLTVLRAIDKLDRLEPKDVMLLLGPGRRDESGDFTKGAGLSEVQSKFVLAAVGFGPGGKISSTLELSDLDELEDAFNELNTRFSETIAGPEGARELREFKRLIDVAGYGDRVVIDRSVVRGLEYYTGLVYEIELLLETRDEKGRPVRFGSVGGGGRYDGLVSRFRPEPVPATGFSIGVSRLQAALVSIRQLETTPETGPVVVTVFDAHRIGDYQMMVSALRKAGIRAELYLGSGKFGAQVKYADKRNSPCVIIQGSDEKSQGVVLIKDCFQGAKNASITDREEYKAAQARVQYPVPEAQLVKAVREVLARHDVRWG
jgi:histidyl-tRNA synthetase